MLVPCGACGVPRESQARSGRRETTPHASLRTPHYQWQPQYHHTIFVAWLSRTRRTTTGARGTSRRCCEPSAERITELDGEGRLLAQAGELMRLIGDVRSELFHYEVRITYDTPEIAENRRIVREAQTTRRTKWQTSEWKPDEDEKPEW